MKGAMLVQLDAGEFQDVLRDMTARIQHLPEDCALATARAVNRTLEAVRAEAVRAASNAYTARAESLRKNTVILKATARNPRGTLKLSGTMGVPLVEFKPSPGSAPNWRGVPSAKRRPKAGVSSLVKRGGKRKVYGEAPYKPFFARVGKGWGLYTRTSVKGNLQQLFGPSPVQMFGSDEARDRLQARAREVFPTRLAHEIDALLAGVSRGKGR